MMISMTFSLFPSLLGLIGGGLVSLETQSNRVKKKLA